LIDLLYTIRNIYPEEHLNECTDPEDEPRFIVGRSALGTMEADEGDGVDDPPPAGGGIGPGAEVGISPEPGVGGPDDPADLPPPADPTSPAAP
jgi:hypothetical protein